MEPSVFQVSDAFQFVRHRGPLHILQKNQPHSLLCGRSAQRIESFWGQKAAVEVICERCASAIHRLSGIERIYTQSESCSRCQKTLVSSSTSLRGSGREMMPGICASCHLPFDYSCMRRNLCLFCDGLLRSQRFSLRTPYPALSLWKQHQELLFVRWSEAKETCCGVPRTRVVLYQTVGPAIELREDLDIRPFCPARPYDAELHGPTWNMTWLIDRATWDLIRAANDLPGENAIPGP